MKTTEIDFFSQTEPGLVGSTKPVILIAKWSYSNSPLETPLRNLEAASNRTQKKIKKKEKKNRNKWNTRNKMK